MPKLSRKRLFSCQKKGVSYLKRGSIVLLGLAMVLTATKPAEATISRIWAVDDGEKIKKEDISNPLANDVNNKVWQNGQVNIFGAKNEVVAFQLIIQADGSGINAANVQISNLSNGSFTIPGSGTGSSDPFDYRGKSIELFTEHYLHITQRSITGVDWTHCHPNAQAPGYLGWVPDTLIPFSAPTGKGGAPFDILPNMNQGVWVDIWIPRDASTGTYTGNATVMVNGLLINTIPINLLVYNFTLPDESHFQNMFYIEPRNIADRHGVSKDGTSYYPIQAKYYQMAHRHRMDLIRHVQNLSLLDTYYKSSLTGSLYTPTNKYEGPGENVGNGTFSIGPYGMVPDEYGGSWANTSQAKWWDGSNQWENWFINNAPLASRHKYLEPDEPKTAVDYDTLKLQAGWTHSNPGVGKNISGFVTSRIVSDIQGYVDFWSWNGKPFQSGTDVASEQSNGNKFGLYNGYRPRIPTIEIDNDATDLRAYPWMAKKYNIDQYFYWETTFFYDNVEGSQTDVFTDPLTFKTNYNGNGTFFYPGQDKIFTAQDRGLAGPLSSIRMKNWRRGMQDFEYLYLAGKNSLQTEADAIVNNVIPAAMWNADLTKPASWSSHGYGFETYRKQLAELIAGSEPTPSPTSQPTSYDLDGDDKAGVGELLILLQNWGSTSSPGDFNNSGKIDAGDLILVLRNWGNP